MSSADLRALSHTRTNTLLSLFSLSFSSLISLLSKAAQKKRGERRLARSRTHTHTHSLLSLSSLSVSHLSSLSSLEGGGAEEERRKKRSERRQSGQWRERERG
jgi:hypothetical protein